MTCAEVRSGRRPGTVAFPPASPGSPPDLPQTPLLDPAAAHFQVSVRRFPGASTENKQLISDIPNETEFGDVHDSRLSRDLEEQCLMNYSLEYCS